MVLIIIVLLGNINNKKSLCAGVPVCGGVPVMVVCWCGIESNVFSTSPPLIEVQHVHTKYTNNYLDYYNK